MAMCCMEWQQMQALMRDGWSMFSWSILITVRWLDDDACREGQSGMSSEDSITTGHSGITCKTYELCAASCVAKYEACCAGDAAALWLSSGGDTTMQKLHLTHNTHVVYMHV